MFKFKFFKDGEWRLFVHPVKKEDKERILRSLAKQGFRIKVIRGI